MDKKRDLTLPDGRELTLSQLADLERESRDYIKDMLERASIPCGRYAVRAVETAIKKMIAVIREDMPEIHRGFRMSSLSRTAQIKIDAIIRDLIDALCDHIFLYGAEVAESDEDRQMVLAILGEDFKGQTTRDRVSKQVAGVRGRIEHFISDDIWNRAGADGSSGWSLIEKTIGAYISTRLIQLLAETEISRVWQRVWQDRHDGAKYVHVFRGSSYPCPICDAEVSKGWQEASKAEFPPFHRSCVCYTVYY